MRVLLADDDVVSLRRLEIALLKWDYEPVLARDGKEAWAILDSDERPPLALVDWMMPGMDGAELCRALRQSPRHPSTYVILVTARTRPEEMVEGLEAGADDYLKKPYRNDELKARLGVGLRVVTLERRLQERVTELEEALSQVKQLQGFLPICSYCRKVRDDKDYWQQLDTYVMDHLDAQFTHSVCPTCVATIVRPEIEALKGKKKTASE